VPDPAALRIRLIAAGAVAGFAGRMNDRRLDRHGELAGRGEVLRVRVFQGDGAGTTATISWKGPATRSAEGYKQRRELELDADGGQDPLAVFRALGYVVVQAIDRRVEYFELHGAIVRLEWYPRMDVLVEVEGTGAAIEAAVAATGIPRDAFTADSLAEFGQRFALRAGAPPVFALEGLGGTRAAWDHGV